VNAKEPDNDLAFHAVRFTFLTPSINQKFISLDFVTDIA
jgi:hypothetical protein